VLVIVVAAVAGLGIWYVLSRRPAEVTVATARERTGGPGGTTVLNASGYVTARRSATVSSKITGKLIDVRVEEGMPVREGQVLARLDDSLYRASLELAESRKSAAESAQAEIRAQLALAELTLERTRRLVAEGVSFQADLDAAATEVEALRARLDLEGEQVRVSEREVTLRRTELSDTVIRAPFSGIVISKDAQPGEMVSPVSAGGGFTRTGICTIVDMESLEIEVDVNESYISRVYPEQRVEATLDAYPDWPIPAHVITTIPAADREKATVLVRIGFDDLDPRILPDMGVKVAFREEAPEGAATARAYVLVPRTAVRREQGRDVVYVVDDDRVDRRVVSAGAASGQDVEVLSGVNAGDRVVIAAPEDLSAGDRVIAR
jgi:RND family efflux transporter MFP subunit